MNRTLTLGMGLVVGLGLMTAGLARAQSNEPAPLWNRCYLSVGGGWLDVEGDEAVDDAGLVSIRLGHDLNEDWSAEIGLDVVPNLSESMRTDWRTKERISRLEEAAGVDATSSLRLNVDVLRHFTRQTKWDPYLAAGGGVVWYEDTFDQEYEAFAQAGAGCFYNCTESWALRADARAILAGSDSEFNSTYSLGMVFRPPPSGTGSDGQGGSPTARQVPLKDSDHDGLSDVEEQQHGTDPQRADSDWDALSDGEEIQKYLTHPLKRDTDGGGVYDGHEVIEDSTGPTQAGDDLQFFELRLMFDPNDWKIKSEYLSEIGVIGKILRDDPAATARIEGHLDSQNQSSVRRAQTLSEQRAQSLREVLTADWGIERKRVTAVGYGVTRPQGPSHPENVNPANERIEIYIRRSTPWR